MVLEEKTEVWIAIKAALSWINKCGLNSVEILLWSQDKDLGQVRVRLGEIKDMVKEDVKHREGDTKEDLDEVHEDMLINYSPDNIESTDHYP